MLQEVRKSDMLSFDNNEIKFNGMGLFSTTSDWLHPSITEITYEIVYVVAGTVFIEEDGVPYELHNGNMLILRPNVIHKGYKTSTGKTSFYWVHFFAKDIQSLINGKMLFSDINQDYIFKEMLHYSRKDNPSLVMTELLLAQILINNAQDAGTEKSRKLVKDVLEWVRIHASPALKTTDIAQNFCYSVDHLSRLLKKEYGKNLKQLVTDLIIEKAKSLLVHTNWSVKEIGASLEFEDTNKFLKFFKYHIGKAPSEYRNLYNITHMNKK